MKQLSFDPQENVGLILSSVKSFWEEDVRGFVLKNVRRNVEWMRSIVNPLRHDFACSSTVLSTS